MWAWLLKVESPSRSFAVYAPIVLADKFVSYIRVVLLTWLVGRAQFGQWQLGVLVFSVMATFATLGSTEGLARYVSYYQARGELRAFYRRAAGWIVLLGAGTTLAGVLCSGWIAASLAGSGESSNLGEGARRSIVLLGLLNGLLMSLYLNLIACIRALRTFRLLAMLELLFSVAFTAAALAVGKWTGNGIELLWAHAGVLGAMLVLGAIGAIRRLERPDSAGAGLIQAQIVPNHSESFRFVPGRLLRYGFVSMLGMLVWQAGNQVSLWFTNHYGTTDQAGVYAAFRQLCQPVWVLSVTMWGVLFSHAASRWESSGRSGAVALVNLGYKAGVLALMSVSVLMLATARWWSLLLSGPYREGLALLGGLLMFYQASANLGLAAMAANLCERPMLPAGIVAGGVLANAILAALWVGSGGPLAAAWSAGAGMALSCVLACICLLAMRFPAHRSAMALLLCPPILALPPALAMIAWAIVLLAAWRTGWVFRPEEKQAIRDRLSGWRPNR